MEVTSGRRLPSVAPRRVLRRWKRIAYACVLKEAEVMRLLRKNGDCMALLQSFTTIETHSGQAAGRSGKVLPDGLSPKVIMSGFALLQVSLI